jgi:alpha-L-fucosidase
MTKASILAHLTDLEPKYTTLILNCPPNRGGMLDANIVTRLAEVGAAWIPNPRRAALPAQPLRCEHPITPVAAYATGFHTGEGPLNALDGRSDKDVETCWSTWSLPLPQSITIDLGGVWSNVCALEYLPKQWNRTGTRNGDITAATIATSADGVTFSTVAVVSWSGGATTKSAEWAPVDAGFLRITVDAATGGYVNIGGLRIGGRTARPALVSRFPVPGRAYQIANHNSGKVLDVTGARTADGSNVIQWPWRGGANQKWTFTSTADGYWKIADTNSGKLLEVAGLSRADGGNVGIWSDTNAPQQQWAVTRIAGGYCLLTNLLSGLALDVSDASTANGARIDQRTYTTAPQQQWQLIPA